MQTDIKFNEIKRLIGELREKAKLGKGWGKAKNIINSVDRTALGDDCSLEAKAFLSYREIKHGTKSKIKNGYKGFVVLLPDAFEALLKDNQSIFYETIIDFIDDNFEKICKDGLWNSVRLILYEIAYFLTENIDFEDGLPQKVYNVRLLFEQYMSKIVIGNNLKNITIDWLRYLTENNTLSNAVCFCEFISDLYLTPSFANESESDYFYIKKLLIDMGGKKNLLLSKISLIYLQHKKGFISKEYYISLLQRLPEINNWPLKNDHLTLSDYLKYPSAMRIGVNNQYRINDSFLLE